MGIGGREGAEESGDTHLMLLIHPPAINLSLKCQQDNHSVIMDVPECQQLFA